VRREERRRFGDGHAGITLTVTRRGIEVHGHYDSFIGLEGGSVSWEELMAMKKKVDEVQPISRSSSEGEVRE
jgi:hypothetical protein